MTDSWLDKIGLSDLGNRLGSGSITGAAIGGGVALLGAVTGLTSGLGWLGWLLVPLAAVAGGAVGNFVSKDGPMFGQPKAPDGYKISKAPNEFTSAIDSQTIARTGISFMSGAKLDMNNDPRLEKLKENARSYRARFSEKTSAEYIADPKAREKKISDEIVRDLGNTYGEYSTETMHHGNAEEHDAERNGRIPQLKNMKKGELVCRHYASITCLLLDEAGIPNHMVGSHVNKIRYKRDSKIDLELVESTTNGSHAYVMIDGSNAIVEPTTAGGDEWDSRTYRPVMNGMSWEDIMKGKTAIVETDLNKTQGRKSVYGGHDGGGINGAEAAMREAVRQHNEKNHKVVDTATLLGNSLANPMLGASTLMALTPAFTPPKPEGKPAAPAPAK